MDARELRRFRLLYTVYPQIRETVSPELLAQDGASALRPFLHLASLAKRESVSPESQIVESVSPQLSPVHPDLVQRLSFSHLAELLELPDETQRRFYEIECIRGNWSVRELRRQIASLYYQRSGLSKNKTKLAAIAHAGAETLQPAQIIRDPYIFEFLGQLNVYVACYKKHEMTLGDQSPVGILLCTRKNEALVEFALGDLSNQLFVSRYAVEMPKKQDMERFLKKVGKEVGYDG